MEPATVSACVVALLVPYVRKAAEEFAGEAGKAVWSKTTELFTKVKSYFAGDPVRKDAIERFMKHPERYQPLLEDHLRESLSADRAFLEGLTRELHEVEQAGPQVKVVMKMKRVREMIGVEAEEMTRGKVDVEQEGEDIGSAKGASIKRIG